jgi:hypothetical protein
MKIILFSNALLLLLLPSFTNKNEREYLTLNETSISICLRGTWIVRCKNGHDDQVDGITCNHDCEKNGCGLKSVDNGKAMVVCPDGHSSRVEGITEQHRCAHELLSGGICGKQCRRE